MKLVDSIMAIEYRQHNAGWLKIVPTAQVTRGASFAQRVALAAPGPASPEARRRCIVEEFFDCHFYYFTPEDSPYAEFNGGTWRPSDRPTMERALDALVAVSEACLAQDAAEAAAERAMAEEGGWSPPSPPWADVFSDYAALRRWFAEELWPGPDVTWFVFAPRQGDHCKHAIVGVDDLLVGATWVW